MERIRFSARPAKRRGQPGAGLELSNCCFASRWSLVARPSPCPPDTTIATTPPASCAERADNLTKLLSRADSVVDPLVRDWLVRLCDHPEATTATSDDREIEPREYQL